MPSLHLNGNKNGITDTDNEDQRNQEDMNDSTPPSINTEPADLESEPQPAVRETTQTDHINKKLLTSFLEHINTLNQSNAEQNGTSTIEMNCEMDSDNELDIVERAERQAQLEDEAAEEPQEVQREENADDDEIQEVQADEADEDNENSEKTVVKPKRAVRNPQPKLNVETLKGPRGLTALPELFAKQKFKGKGHEESDLGVVLKTYEYWCHRLFPKLRFDQCVEKIESLGNKKPTITYIKRIRMGLLDEPQENVINSDEEDATPATLQQQQQIESVESRFDELMTQGSHLQAETQLTDAQKEMIRANKERALKLRQERLQRIQQQAEAKLGVSEVLPSTVTESQPQDVTDESMNVSAIERQLQDKTTQRIQDTHQQMDVGTGAKELSLLDDDDEFDMVTSQIVVDKDKGVIAQTKATDATQDSSQSQDLFATSQTEKLVDKNNEHVDSDIPEDCEVGVESLLNVLQNGTAEKRTGNENAMDVDDQDLDSHVNENDNQGTDQSKGEPKEVDDDDEEEVAIGDILLNLGASST